MLLGYVGETAILIRKIRLEMKSHFLKVISFVSILLTTWIYLPHRPNDKIGIYGLVFN